MYSLTGNSPKEKVTLKPIKNGLTASTLAVRFSPLILIGIFLPSNWYISPGFS